LYSLIIIFQVLFPYFHHFPKTCKVLFAQYPGFVHCELIKAKHCAFIDYETEQQATNVLRALQPIELKPGVKLNINYKLM